MKTIKIIDLLNKIANGEEVPKKIKYRDWLYEFEKDCNDYMCQYDSLLYRENDDTRQFLNDEVEILEEENKIKHIGKTYDITDFKKEFPEAACLLKDTSNKLYEIIDEINKLKENK